MLDHFPPCRIDLKKNDVGRNRKFAIQNLDHNGIVACKDKGIILKDVNCQMSARLPALAFG